ncbi:MAG: hypothetical protein QNL12_16040 [Acidimicrobiia bacterium]|nr:hypothetical protein [Acidimicrobiia bacterium]MDX2468823.1 hypothetical protein [Acidimicrobiia bacterium]
MSEQTPNREGLCVYCGTARPVAKPICPQCGHTWIDTKIGEQLPPLTFEIVAASVEEREAVSTAAVSPDPAAAKPRRPWGLLVGAALGLALVLAALSGVFSGDGDDTAAPTTTVTAASDTTTATTNTTAATTTSPTTSAPTTTTTPPTTTTTTILPPLEAEGAAIAVQDLTLGAFALGPFSFDADAQYLGRLVASLGQPDARHEAGTELGLCDGEQGVAYVWDGLTTVFRIDGDQEVLVGYRLDATESDHPTQAITSRSGLALGHTVAKLDAIYLQSGLAFDEIEGSQHFLLLRSSDNATLLWGPVTSNASDGVIEGIYSPRACDGGPNGTP